MKPAYAIPVLLGLLLLFFFPVTSHLAKSEDRRRYFRIQIVTLFGAVAGAKLAFLMGDRFWPVLPLSGWADVWNSGRSIVGGLAGGFLAAEIAKPLMAYPLPPNDRFATLLPFSIAIGRIGCLLQGCCLGKPYEGPFHVVAADGVARHPAPVYELLFQLAIGAVFIGLVRRGRLPGRLFAVYLIAYGLFRFGNEFLRDTPKVWGDVSVYQFLALALVPLGIGSLLLRAGAAPKAARTEEGLSWA